MLPGPQQGVAGLGFTSGSWDGRLWKAIGGGRRGQGQSPTLPTDTAEKERGKPEGLQLQLKALGQTLHSEDPVWPRLSQLPSHKEDCAASLPDPQTPSADLTGQKGLGRRTMLRVQR